MEIRELLYKLVRQRSITDTADEREMSLLVYDLLREYPYFKLHPSRLELIEIEGDPNHRLSVLAEVKGEAGDSKRALIAIGHTDTVGISDYGPLKEYAFDPDELKSQLLKMKDRLSEEVVSDLQSDDYLFGRGIFDMKCGVAILMKIVEEMSQRVKEFSGSLFFAAVPDEESNSLGMLSIVKQLAKRKENYDYRLLLDADYMTSLEKGDPKRYIYVGTVGKLMPAFYCVGKETHVGEIMKGLDPNLFTARITEELSMNPLHCDEAESEKAQAPACLYMRDQKKEYSVQTAPVSVAYFNYATHSVTPEELLNKMKAVAEKCSREVLDRYQSYTKENAAYRDMAVLSFEELYQKVKEEKGEAFEEEYLQFVREIAQKDMDSRDKGISLVSFVHDHYSDRDPKIIVAYLPPYYPHVFVTEENEKGRELYEALEESVNAVSCHSDIEIRKFYPYISDLSYVNVSGNIDALRNNLPGFGSIYDLPLKEMGELNLPVVNIGPFGKDAHKFTERLQMSYSFDVVPVLIRNLIEKILK